VSQCQPAGGHLIDGQKKARQVTRNKCAVIRFHWHLAYDYTISVTTQHSHSGEVPPSVLQHGMDMRMLLSYCLRQRQTQTYRIRYFVHHWYYYPWIIDILFWEFSSIPTYC